MNDTIFQERRSGSTGPVSPDATQSTVEYAPSIVDGSSAEQSFATPQDDYDALILFQGETWLTGTEHGRRDLAATRIYSRGRELQRQRQNSSPHVLSILEECYTDAAFEFAFSFGRLPVTGDVLRFEDLETCATVKRYLAERFIGAWMRQIPERGCPLRHQNGCLFKQVHPELNNGGLWQEEIYDHPEVLWREIACEATGMQVTRCQAASIAGVIFVDDEQRCRPATERELREPSREPTGGLMGALVKAATRTSETRPDLYVRRGHITALCSSRHRAAACP